MTNAITELFVELLANIWERFHAFVVDHGPGIVLAVAILLLGWILAVILRQTIHKLLRGLGFNLLCEKFGAVAFLARGGVVTRPSYLVGLTVYWILLIGVLTVVFATLGLETAHEFLIAVLQYIPRILVALILLALGVAIGNYAGRAVETTLRLADVPLSGLIGQLGRWAIIGLAVLNAIQYLDLAGPIVFQVLLILFVAIPVLAFLTLLIGGREIVSSMLAGRFLRRELAPGVEVELDGIAGTIEEIRLVTTRIGTGDDHTVDLPNSRLLTGTLRRKRPKIPPSPGREQTS